MHPQQVCRWHQAVWRGWHIGGRFTIQRDLDRLKRWACVNLMKFNKVKCNILHLDWGNSKHKYWKTESSPEEKDLGVLTDEKLNPAMCAHSPEASHILGCTKSDVTSRLWEVILQLYSALVWPHLESWVQLWGSQHERHGPVRARPEEGHKNDQMAAVRLLWRQAKRVGVFQPGEEKALGRSYCSLPVPEGGLWESWRGTFYKGV